MPLRSDVVMAGRRRDDGAEVYLVTEVSPGVGVGDVTRARVRANILEKLGRPAVAVVAGRRIGPEAGTYAESRGVWQLLNSDAGEDMPAQGGLD